MARKIRAKTLAGLLGGFLARHPAEVAEKAAEISLDEAAGLLGLLAPRDAWALLRLVPAETAQKWLRQCESETLRRLLPAATPADASVGELQAAALEQLDPAEAAD
jgi:hypothetical protein